MLSKLDARRCRQQRWQRGDANFHSAALLRALQACLLLVSATYFPAAWLGLPFREEPPQGGASPAPAAMSRRALGSQLALLAANTAVGLPAADALVGSTLSPDIEAKVQLKGGSIADFIVKDSGLRYIDLLEGRGEECCAAGSSVVVDWSLRRVNGYFVDSSFGFDQSRGIDERFGVGAVPELRFVPVGAEKSSPVVRGVQEGVLGMRVGGTRRLIVPPELAYAAYGKDELAPLPEDWGKKRQIERLKNQPFIFEIKLRALRD
mmetsp:Transcript_7915/g.17511  ORF Transcript_7915/g.17511 Transcript_7915/m.17511 type:complete len:263 (-) Transcript_7915:67-855(-)